jgi:hypothetical protein
VANATALIQRLARNCPRRWFGASPADRAIVDSTGQVGNYMDNAASIDPRSIQPWSLPFWAAKTAALSLSTYQPRKRPLSAGRLLRLLGPNLRLPVFIVVAPRSGTTFLGECVAALPEISYHYEPVATKAAARYVQEGRWPDFVARRFYREVYGWLMRLHLDADLRFAEKTPRNCFVMAFLAQSFPEAQFVHIIRDGRDAAVSLSRQPWLSYRLAGLGLFEPGGYPMGPWAQAWVEPERISEFQSTSDTHRAVWAWRRYTETAIQSGSKLPPDRYHELRYENLAVRPAREADRLLDFLRIDSPESRAQFHARATMANSKSIGRWKDCLDRLDRQVVEAEAGGLLRDLGYHS